MNRSAIFAAPFVLLLSGSELSTQYSEERALKVEMRSTMKIETEVEMRRDGEPIESQWGGGGMKLDLARHAVYVDRTLASADGKPTRVRRSFEKLENDSTLEFGEESRDLVGECPLEGVTLELAVDDDGEVEVEVVEGDAPDAKEALEGHGLALDLDGLLPQGAVEAGASWDLDNQAVRRALGYEVERALFPRTEPEAEEGGGRGRRGSRGADMPFLRDAQWTGKAKLVSLDEEHGNVRCALIELELETSGELPEQQWGGGRGRERAFELEAGALIAFENTYEIKLEGKLYFALGERMPARLELEGTLRTESHTEREGRDGGTFEIDSTSSGPVTCTVDVAVVQDTKD